MAALRRYLAGLGVECWTTPLPRLRAIERYGPQLYCIALVPSDDARRDLARAVVAVFFDLYDYQRGWIVLKNAQDDSFSLLDALRADLFPAVTAAEVNDLLRKRRLVVLQGPPGTGKTQLAEFVRRDHFGDRRVTVQFHPAVTYEDFVVVLSPDT